MAIPKPTYANTYSSFVHNCQKLKAGRNWKQADTFNVFIDKQTAVHPYAGILFSDKNK